MGESGRWQSGRVVDGREWQMGKSGRWERVVDGKRELGECYMERVLDGREWQMVESGMVDGGEREREREREGGQKTKLIVIGTPLQPITAFGGKFKVFNLTLHSSRAQFAE